MRVLIIGRFQPFHLGHLKLLRQAAKRGKVIMVLGSSNESFTKDNPMTLEERQECIKKVLGSEGMEAEIVPLPDFHDNDEWTEHLLSLVSDFDLVISGNSLVRRLLKERGYAVEEPDYLEDRWKYKGTHIRECMARGESVEDKVPEVVADFLKKNKIAERLISLG